MVGAAGIAEVQSARSVRLAVKVNTPVSTLVVMRGVLQLGVLGCVQCVDYHAQCEGLRVAAECYLGCDQFL